MEKMVNKRLERFNRHVTSKIKGTPDGNCIHQTVEEVGEWPATKQPMQRVRYYHVTKGWRTRLLMPIYRRFGV